MATLAEVNSYITALEKALAMGVLTVVVDGVTTTFANADDLQNRLRYFRRQSDSLTTGKRKRPAAASINLGGF